MIISEIQSEIGHCSCDSAKFKATTPYCFLTLSLINLEWPIGNDAEDKRGCQGVQSIIGKPVNGHLGPHKLGPLQIQPLTNSTHIVIIWENYTNDDIHVPISELLKEC